MRLLRIAFKSIWKRNLGNKTFCFCIAVFLILPTLLYSIGASVVKEVEDSRHEVFGSFTDILYVKSFETDLLDKRSEDTSDFLNGFDSTKIGVISSVFSNELTESKKLSLGFADENAIELGNIKIKNGRMPVNSGEIAICESILALLSNESAVDNSGVSFVFDSDGNIKENNSSKQIGDIVIIADKSFTICGIVQDYGRLWIRSEEQDKEKTTPVNAFVTQQDSAEILKETRILTQQFLLVASSDNFIPSVENSGHFQNTNITNNVSFEIPTHFMVITFLISLVAICIILTLNGKRLQKRCANYYRMGLKDTEILKVFRIELVIMYFCGMIIAGVFSYIFTRISLLWISNYVDQNIAFMFDYKTFGMLALVMFIPILISIFLFSAFETDKGIEGVISGNSNKNKKIKLKKGFHFSSFLLKKYLRSLLALAFVGVFTFSLVAYGVFYGNYFKGDITEMPPGTLPRDYDFQFISHPQPAPPWENYETDPVLFFTDTYEKLGAKQEFVDKLKSDPKTENVKAYRENNKYSVLLKNNQIDDYIDASDFMLDGMFGEKGLVNGFTDYGMICDKFGYESDDVFIGSDILGYPEEVLTQLSRSVVEGEINIEKIKSGEEVVLRVPAYILDTIDGGGISKEKVDPNTEGAFNLTALKVGDSVSLTSLISDEYINGAVPQSYLDKFTRKDITVKIGAIIRNTDGIFYSTANMLNSLSFLTVNEAFERLDIEGNYSIVSVYGNTSYSDSELIEHFMQYSEYSGVNMEFQNWISDTKTYRIFNLMVAIFVGVLLLILALTALFIMTAQFLNLTSFSLKTYTLLRINGLPIKKIIFVRFLQSFGIALLSCVVGIPVSFLLIRYLGIEENYDVITTVLYYFPLKNYLYIALSALGLALIAEIPSMVKILKSKRNITKELWGERLCEIAFLFSHI